MREPQHPWLIAAAYTDADWCGYTLPWTNFEVDDSFVAFPFRGNTLHTASPLRHFAAATNTWPVRLSWFLYPVLAALRSPELVKTNTSNPQQVLGLQVRLFLAQITMCDMDVHISRFSIFLNHCSATT